MKQFIPCLFCLLVLLLSCQSKPAAIQSPADEPVSANTPSADTAEVFDPGSISQEIFDSTKVDVQRFIEDMNQIIRSRNYQEWVSHLGDEYFAEKSSPEYLAQTSEQPRLKTQKIVLNSPQDYFVFVVVPSRANDRVDDIEFVSPTRVKAYTVTPNGQRLRLYDLETSGNSWKIIN
ncbi:MAG: hypothetical protein LBL28_06290 [Treponema sp.]|jgi:hypothetical protein|nr:hypothetical protein [Treponema sp.]